MAITYALYKLQKLRSKVLGIRCGDIKVFLMIRKALDDENSF